MQTASTIAQWGHHGGTEWLETDEQEAQRLVVEELLERGRTEQELKKHRTTHSDKVKMTARWQGQTIMTLDWNARRLQVGCRYTVANCLKGYFFPTIAGTDPY